MRALVAVVVVLAASLVACRGPEPVVTRQTLPAGEAGAPLRVEAMVVNRSGGSGQVSVVADVTERGSGTLIARESKEIELDAHGSQGVVLELRVPSLLKAGAAERLELRVAAHYPIE